MKRIAITAITAIALMAGMVATADACGCNPPGYKACTKNRALPYNSGGGYLSVTANRHTTCAAARSLVREWQSEDSWHPQGMSAAGKLWTWTSYRHFTVNANARTIVYRNGRSKVTLYWSEYGAG